MKANKLSPFWRLTMNELSKCPVCGSKTLMANHRITHRVGCISATCHLCGPLRESPEEAVEAWGELCEEIRLGRIMYKILGTTYRINSEKLEMSTDDEFGTYLKMALEPIAQPLSKNDVLRECAEVIRNGITDVYDSVVDKEEEMLKKIDAVLAEGEGE